MKVRIESDGTTTGTRVVDVDTGRELERVSSIVWELEAVDGVARADISTVAERAVVTADANVTSRCPHCGHEETIGEAGDPGPIGTEEL